MNLHQSNYWDVHRQIWNQEYDKLDGTTAQKIMSDPQCPESIQFNERVKQMTENQIGALEISA